MKLTIFLILVIGSLAGYAFADDGEVRKYKDSGGALFMVCKDKDGYSVYKSGGGVDHHGTGYKWSDIRSQYNLKSDFKVVQENVEECPAEMDT